MAPGSGVISPEALEPLLLRSVHEKGGMIPDSWEFAASINVDHQAVVGMMKSLQASEMLDVTVRSCCHSLLHCSDRAYLMQRMCERDRPGH